MIEHENTKIRILNSKTEVSRQIYDLELAEGEWPDENVLLGLVQGVKPPSIAPLNGTVMWGAGRTAIATIFTGEQAPADEAHVTHSEQQPEASEAPKAEDTEAQESETEKTEG